jgi:hypothetical protein
MSFGDMEDMANEAGAMRLNNELQTLRARCERLEADVACRNELSARLAAAEQLLRDSRARIETMGNHGEGWDVRDILSAIDAFLESKSCLPKTA